MIEINLIPDVKQEFIRAQRTRNTVISFTILAMLAAATTVGVLGLILGAQNVRESLAGNSIKSEFSKLSSVSDINKIVTIQNQLSQISDINAQKGINSRLFDLLTAINPTVPNDIKMSNIVMDPTQNTIQIDGSAARSYAATDVFKKTILNTGIDYTEGGTKQSVPLTTDVTLSQTSYGQDASGAQVLRFTLLFTYPSELFSNKISSAHINSPTGSIDVTDSRTQIPLSLFSQKAADLPKPGSN